MKPLPPAQIIAEYRAAREAAGARPVNIEYASGWFEVRDHVGVFSRYRGAQIVHMTGQLWGRVQSRKADQ